MTISDLIMSVNASVDFGDTKLVREDIRDALVEWGRGQRNYVGDFLRAVLSNDLTEAMGRADAYNRITLPAIVGLCYNELPSECWGSAEKVRVWAKRHSPEGKAYAAFLEVFNRLHLTHFAGTHYEPFSAEELAELETALDTIPLGSAERVEAARTVTMLRRDIAIQAPEVAR